MPVKRSAPIFFVNSRIFASMVIVYSESSLSEDLQRTLLAALDEGVAALVESKFVSGLSSQTSIPSAP